MFWGGRKFSAHCYCVALQKTICWRLQHLHVVAPSGTSRRLGGGAAHPGGTRLHPGRPELARRAWGESRRTARTLHSGSVSTGKIEVSADVSEVQSTIAVYHSNSVRSGAGLEIARWLLRRACRSGQAHVLRRVHAARGAEAEKAPRLTPRRGSCSKGPPAVRPAHAKACIDSTFPNGFRRRGMIVLRNITSIFSIFKFDFKQCFRLYASIRCRR